VHVIQCRRARRARAQSGSTRLEEASRTLSRLEEAAATFGMGQFGTEALAVRAILMARRRDAEAAVALTAALSHARLAQDPWMEILLQRAVARLGGDDAMKAARTALRIAEDRGFPVEVARGYTLLAEVLKQTDCERARKASLRARRLNAAMGLGYSSC